MLFDATDEFGIKYAQKYVKKTGNPYDNSVVESFFKNMKAEELYRTKYHSELELKRAIQNYIDFHNKKDLILI